MSISSVQEFLKDFIERGSAHRPMAESIAAKHPTIGDSARTRNVADHILIDMIEAFKFRVNALDVPEQHRSNFIGCTIKEQSSHLRNIGISPKVLERFSEAISASGSDPDMAFFYKLGYPDMSSVSNSPKALDQGLSKYSDFATW